MTETPPLPIERLPRWACRVLAVMWYLDAAFLCTEPFLADGPAKIALYAMALVCWLVLAWPLAKTMGGNALRFSQSRKTPRDVLQTNVGDLFHSTYACFFLKRSDGFSPAFLAFYHAGLALFVLACLAHPVLLLAPWK